MSAALQITLSPRAQQLLAAAPAWPLALRGAIAAAMDKENELTTGQIQRRKLSVRGPQTLGVRTNRLRLSARPTKATVTADAILSSIGSNVKYAGVHEYGFTGSAPVKAYTRRAPQGDRFKNGQGGTIARLTLQRGGIKPNARAQVSSGFAQVRAHTRKMNFPARAPFRTGIEERLPNYSAALSRAIVAVFTQPSGGAA